MKITTPFPPSVNHYWRNVRNRVYISKEGVDFARTVARMRDTTKRSPLAGRLVVTVHLYAPNKRRYDIDNRCKALLDALTKSGVWLDDEQIDELKIIRCSVAKENPRAEVEIYERT